ncbi:MAG: hypothetical protein NVSMB56_07430 [Pyrinomonadaceae bacterium]
MTARPKPILSFALGVRELWLVDAETRSVEVRYALPQRDADNLPRWASRIFKAGENAESQVLENWFVAVDELFKGLV